MRRSPNHYRIFDKKQLGKEYRLVSTVDFLKKRPAFLELVAITHQLDEAWRNNRFDVKCCYWFSRTTLALLLRCAGSCDTPVRYAVRPSLGSEFWFCWFWKVRLREGFWSPVPGDCEKAGRELDKWSTIVARCLKWFHKEVCVCQFNLNFGFRSCTSLSDPLLILCLFSP